MRKIILSAIYLFISVLAFAQTNPVKVADFFADFEIKPYNGDVMDTVYNTGVDVILPVFMRFKLKVPYGSGNVNTTPQKCYATIMYEHANGFDFNTRGAGNELELNRSEWTPLTGSMYSPYVKVDLTLYKEYLKSGKLKTYYMSEYDAVNRGWQNRLEANYKRNITVVQVPNFIGSSQICDAATYTIERPEVVTLENASGIATLTALGNNQWKVTRIGSANGVVRLRSTSNGKNFDKEILVGTVTKGNISGNGVLQLGESQTYTLTLDGNTDYNWSVSYNPNVTWTKLSATSIKLSTTGSVPMGWSENITISAQAAGNCGTASNYISKTIKFVNERDPRLD